MLNKQRNIVKRNISRQTRQTDVYRTRGRKNSAITERQVKRLGDEQEIDTRLPIRAIERNSQVASNRKYLSCVAEIQSKIAESPSPLPPLPSLSISADSAR